LISSFKKTYIKFNIISIGCKNREMAGLRLDYVIFSINAYSGETCQVFRLKVAT